MLHLCCKWCTALCRNLYSTGLSRHGCDNLILLCNQLIFDSIFRSYLFPASLRVDPVYTFLLQMSCKSASELLLWWTLTRAELDKTRGISWVWKLVFISLMMAIQWSSHFLLMRGSWSEKLLHWTAIVLDWLLGVSLGWPGCLVTGYPRLLLSSLLETCNNKDWYFKQSTCLKCIHSCLFKMNKNFDYILIHFDLCWHAIQVC